MINTSTVCGNVEPMMVRSSCPRTTTTLVGVYTSPGRWGAHYTTVHYCTPQEKKLAVCSVYV
jgi:hypothetical protein